MDCTHLSQLRPVQFSNVTEFNKEECSYCFNDQDSTEGVDLCLFCLVTTCAGDTTTSSHSSVHHKNTHHPLYLNIRRRKLPPQQKYTSDGPPSPKLSKLSIAAEEEDRFEYSYQPHCRDCQTLVDPTSDDQLSQIISVIETGPSTAQRAQVQAWEETRTSCEHVLLTQTSPDALPVSQQVKCYGCDLASNLWLCLTCGATGCGRRHFDGSGGMGHGLEHFQETGHQVACKLGTITPEGEADIYCYACDDERLDPELAAHLKPLGIQVASQTKTEKTMTELQLEYNLKFDFSMVAEDGIPLELVGGPGLTGLKNIGNSCYLASVVQAVFSQPLVRDRYLAQQNHMKSCTNPLQCFICQASKLADGIHSGRYSDIKSLEEGQEGIAPTLFKRLVGKDHPEFRTMQQQDAYEFLDHLQTIFERAERATDLNPSTISLFQFNLEHRLECLSCKGVRYTTETARSLSLPVTAVPDSSPYDPTSLAESFRLGFSPEVISDYQCPACQIKTTASKTMKFLTFPSVLAIHLHRFALVQWVPTKQEVHVEMPENDDIATLLALYQAPPRPEGETLLPEDNSQASGVPEVDPNQVDQILAMGVSEIRAKKALIATKGDVEAAVAWVFDHMDDPDIDEPLASSSSKSTSNTADPEKVGTLSAMGFSESHATAALNATSGDVERAVEWLFSHPDEADLPTEHGPSASNTSSTSSVGFSEVAVPYQLTSFVSHKGTSTHCGHYVAHIKHGEKWILFNDRKVAHQPQPPKEQAYIYFFTRPEAAPVAPSLD